MGPPPFARALHALLNGPSFQQSLIKQPSVTQETQSINPPTIPLMIFNVFFHSGLLDMGETFALTAVYSLTFRKDQLVVHCTTSKMTSSRDAVGHS